MIYNYEYNILYKLNNLLSDPEKDNYTGRTFYIDRKYAREETRAYHGKQEDIKDVDNYEFFIPKQIGTYRNRRDAIILIKLPKSKIWISIILYMDGGVGFDKQFHKHALREFDSLDRRIILGFCDKYHRNLVEACYGGEFEYENICTFARGYRASSYKKRINQGRAGIDKTDFYQKSGSLEPYEESSIIFKNVIFI